MSYKKWIIAQADKELASVLSEKLNIDPFISFLLTARGIDNELAMSKFLSNSVELSDPYLLSDMDRAVARIEDAIDYGEKITVFGDYDCDGVTSTALLVSLLRDMGGDVDYYIPSRMSEGYGLNKPAIKQIAESGTRLIVTVDNGISAVEEAEYIYSLGMQLVVTDHHQLGEVLPMAEAVVNPHRPDNELEFHDLCGVGVAFKLACALYGDAEDMLWRYADLVAIGTVADVVPLLDENRALVKFGLQLINQNSREAISALRRVAGIEDKKITASEIAFQLSPRINAMGRVSDAADAVRLLLSEDYNEIETLAKSLNDNNAMRQQLEMEIFADAKAQLDADPSLAAGRVIVICGRDYHQGAIGIVASKLLNEYSKPVIVMSSDGEVTRGSARSVDGFNIYEAIAACSDILEQFGGHPKAAGLTVLTSRVDEFRKMINDYAAEAYPVMPEPVVEIDAKLSPFYLNLELAKALDSLEPYGECNRRAVFALSGLNITDIVPMGNGAHIRIECEKKGRKIRIVMFKMTADDFPFKIGASIDAAVKIGVNPFNGKEYLSVQAVDIRPHGLDDKYFAEREALQLFNSGKTSDKSVFPSRQDCAYIYKTIRFLGGKSVGFDDLYFKLDNITYAQLFFAVKAFEEAELVSVNNEKITLSQTQEKVDLMNTNTMKTLKGRLCIE